MREREAHHGGVGGKIGYASCVDSRCPRPQLEDCLHTKFPQFSSRVSLCIDMKRHREEREKSHDSTS